MPNCLKTVFLALLWLPPAASGVELVHAQLDAMGAATASINGKAAAGTSIPYFPSAADALGRQGFARIVNLSNRDGEASITAFDDSGRQHGPVTLTLDALETVHLNSGDLEDGNAGKGLATGVGRPTEGDWRLELTSELVAGEECMGSYAVSVGEVAVTRHAANDFWSRPDLMVRVQRQDPVILDQVDGLGSRIRKLKADRRAADEGIRPRLEKRKASEATPGKPLTQPQAHWLAVLGADEAYADREADRHLHEAVAAGEVETVKSLIALGADVSARDATGWYTPLHGAAREGRTEIVQALIAAGADVNTKDNGLVGETPLHGAAREGHTETVQALLAAGADVNIRDDSTEATPLFMAAYKGNLEIVKALLDAGADLGIKNKRGATAVEGPSALCRFGGSVACQIVALLTEASQSGVSSDSGTRAKDGTKRR